MHFDELILTKKILQIKKLTANQKIALAYLSQIFPKGVLYDDKGFQKVTCCKIRQASRILAALKKAELVAVDDDHKYYSRMPYNTDTSEFFERKKQTEEIAKNVLTYLNERATKAYTPRAANLKNIIARLEDKFSEIDCKRVIEFAVNDPFFATHRQHINPITLFRPSKFEKYLQNAPEIATKQSREELIELERLHQEKRKQEHGRKHD